MYFVCVICMVGIKRNPLKELTSERRQLWEVIISSRVNIIQLRQCLLLVCSDCNQLLDTMLEFRQTMEIGAKNLLGLYRNSNFTTSSPLIQKLAGGHKLPSVIGPQFDLLLPVANEEIVQSTESWSDCEAAESLATKNKTVKRPPASLSGCINHKAVHVSDHNVDYAVLIPINEKKSSNLLCEEDVVYRISETSKIDEAMPMPTDDKGETIEAKFPIVSESSEVKKIKLNRQLFEAIRATLQSPTLTEEFDIKYEPESESESACKSAVELERKSAPELECESAFEFIREMALKLESASKLKLERKSAPELVRESPFELIREYALKLERESNLNLERESEAELNRKSSSELERVSTFELIRETALKLERKSKLKLQCKSEVELASESAPELARESALESALESIRESALQLERESKLKLQGKADNELASESALKFERKSAAKLAREPGLKLERESAPKLASESGHESDPDSESTLSGESNYEDPEMFPNIIFAKLFNGISEKGPGVGKCLTQEGKTEDLQIHSHIVTNPPSEWPCTWESCQLQSCVDEDEAETPAVMPREVSIYRSKRQSVPRRPKCKLCGRSYGTLMNLWRHYEREHVEPALKCDVCRKECRNETELKFHKMKHQFKNMGVYEELSGRYVCAECGVRCKSASNLRLHLRSRGHGDKMLWRFQCDICKRKCPDKRRIADHIQREHLAQEAVKCPMCTVCFKSARSLRRHASMHILAMQHTQTDTQTQQPPKRARKTHTNGYEDDILAKGEARLETRNSKKRKTHKVNSDTQTQQPPKRARYTHTNRYEEADILPNLETRLFTNAKKPRKAYKVKSNHKQVYTQDTYNERFDTTDINRQTRRRPSNTQKVKSNHKQVYTQNTYNEQFDTTDMNVQTRPRNGQIKKDNRQGNRHTDYRQGRNTSTTHTDIQPHRQGNIPTEFHTSRADNIIHSTESTDIQTNRQGTHTEFHTYARADNMSNAHRNEKTQTNGVRKKRRRKKCAYATRKQARKRSPAGQQANDVAKTTKAKTSLFDMLSSFIL